MKTGTIVKWKTGTPEAGQGTVIAETEKGNVVAVDLGDNTSPRPLVYVENPPPAPEPPPAAPPAAPTVSV